MAIKRRPQATQLDPAAVEAFGAAAEATEVSAAEAPPKAPTTGAAARTLLIRYPDADLPRELAAVAALEERSQHATALRALRRGLAILRAEAGE
jgi:hypothetical protein